MSFLFQSTTTTTTTRQCSIIGKNALCFGINNYPGTANDLRGCINDALEWSDVLKNLYGFGIEVYLDSQANKNTFINRLAFLINESRAGHHIVVTYSGHGTNVADQDGDEPDGRDEAICLYGDNLIDDDIRNILKNLHPEARLTFISDSCHSGTLTRAFIMALSNVNVYEYIVPRYLPPEDENEAARVRTSSITGKILYPEENMKEVLIAGCLPTEYSYDASFNGKPFGAFTYYATRVLRETPSITYKDFYDKLSTRLPNSNYPQTPQCEGSISSKNVLMFN